MTMSCSVPFDNFEANGDNVKREASRIFMENQLLRSHLNCFVSDMLDGIEHINNISA